jgi:hypothetical protein
MCRHYKDEFNLMQETLICVGADNAVRYDVYGLGSIAVEPRKYLRPYAQTEMKAGLQLVTVGEHVPAEKWTAKLMFGKYICLYLE